MRPLVLIGVDDTDVPGSPGTGRVARGLASHLEAIGLAKPDGVTRHQLLVHPAIPYTSHNSALCIAAEPLASLPRLAEVCRDYLEAQYVPGSDPGLCVAHSIAVGVEVQGFGAEAQRRVLTPEDAWSVAPMASGLELRSIAGSPQGVIGALAAVGLRAGGNDGRFVDLPGIRGLCGTLSVSRLLQRTGITAVRDEEGRALGGDDLIETLDWVRPSLVDGEPVLIVRRQAGRPGHWAPRERRHGGTAPGG